MTEEDNGKFDFENCKQNIPPEKIQEILKGHTEFLDKIREQRRKEYYILPNDESKLAWLRKALMNSLALNTLFPEFSQPFRKLFAEFAALDDDSNGSIAKMAISEVFKSGGAHIAFHIAEELAYVEYVIFYKEQKKKEADELAELNELYKKETP